MKFLCCTSFVVCLPCIAAAQLEFEREPVNYSESVPTDPVMRLAERLEAGKTTLEWDNEHGYLNSVLSALEVPVSSQTLVFSKTSLQVGRITPQTPRALYFNDDVYVGWVQRGDFIELSAADPQLGGTFYSLRQDGTRPPQIKRETSRCLQCHGSTHTRRIPGHIIRSVFPDRSGRPVYRLGTHRNDLAAPYEERWGGWYVSGRHGVLRHRGNVLLSDPNEVEELDIEAGANVTELSKLLDTSPYLTSHSDIVALLVLQHQVHVHNVLTAANHSGRITEHSSGYMNKALDRPVDYESDSTKRRYTSAADKVVRALLCADERPLPCSVEGTSNFAAEFSARGPFDAKGRSLRELNLKTRLLRYPCSYLITSEAFRALPSGVMSRVQARLNAILNGSDSSDDFAHLNTNDRTAIRTMIQDLRFLSPETSQQQ